MATFLLDTCVIIDALNGKRSRPARLRELVTQGHLLACCPVNITEIYAGMRKDEETQTQQLLESLQFFPITFPVARLAGLLKRDWQRQGVTINIADATIAAVAIHYKLPLITDNAKDFPMQELQLYGLE